MQAMSLKWFASHMRSVTIRNLNPQSEVFRALPSPRLVILACGESSSGKSSIQRRVSATSNDVIFSGDAVQECCNPSWTISTIEPEALQSHSSDTILSLVLVESSCEAEEWTIVELGVELDSLVSLGRVEMSALPRLPLNTVFFTSTEDCLWVSEKALTQINQYCQGAAALKPFSVFDNGLGGGGGAGNKSSDDDRDDAQDSERFTLLETIEKKGGMLDTLREQVRQQMDATSTRESQVVRQAVAASELELLKRHLLEAEMEMAAEEAAEQADLESLRDTTDIQQSMEQCELYLKEIKETQDRKRQLEEDEVKVQFLLEARQLKLLSELQTIYPIEKVPSSEAGGKDRYAIRGVELPPLDSSNDEQLSTVLGYIVHLMLLASKYLEVPLRYQLLFYASRSMIRDPLQANPLQQNLPLHRTTEPERFKRAIVWLTKDVEQLLLTRSVPYEKNKDILYNLHMLFRTEMSPNAF